MITGFEEITEILNEKERAMIPYLVLVLKEHKKENPIKSPKLLIQVNAFAIDSEKHTKLSEPRLRKCCNYIRSNSILPLIATSEGYYISDDKKIIKSQINSFQQRIDSMSRCMAGLSKFIEEETI